jgi:hypothetical protein
MSGGAGEGDALVAEILQTVATEYPLTELNLTLEISVTFEQGIILYNVRVQNNTDKVIRKIVIRPSIDEEVFQIEERARTVGPLTPGSAQTVIFRLKPVQEKWELGVPGKIFGGRDIAMKAILKTEDGVASYELELANTKKYSIRFLKVKPILPEDFVAMEQEKTINLLEAGEKKKVKFDLIARKEWEALQKHEDGLKKHWIFFAEKPRRKRRGYPRKYTKEEMAEIRRHILFTEADEELLKLIGDKGIDEEALEIGLIFDYLSLIEEEALEEDFELRTFVIDEPIDESPLEIEFDFSKILSVIEEDPFEEDFDIETIRDVRPLDLEGAHAEDIEIEPMEMDI